MDVKANSKTGWAFGGVKGDRLYPSVGMKKPGEHLRVNFGRQPFVFDIDRMVEQERTAIMAEIDKVDVSNLHPPDDENALIHNLIGQYLAHEGYVETAKAFANDVHEQQQSLPTSSQSQGFHILGEEDDKHAFNRQKIRRAILDGDIDKALKYINTFYQHVLEEERNKDIHFRLRCRKFIEMMRRYTELLAAKSTSSPSALAKSVESLASNGHAPQSEELPPSTQMELDDQLHRETSSTSPSKHETDDVDMDASQDLPSKATSTRHNELLTAAITYGQELQSTFGGDPRQWVKKQLSDVFAMLAYTDPAESVVGALLDPRGRVGIAEEVNGAILGTVSPQVIDTVRILTVSCL